MELKIQKYKTFAAEITTLGGLLQSAPNFRCEILDHQVVKDLIEIIGDDEPVDPIILTAVVTFAKDLYETEELKYDEDKMKEYAEPMQKMVNITPYLGLDKYIDLLQMTRVYHEDEKGTGEAKPKFTEGGSMVSGASTHRMNN